MKALIILLIVLFLALIPTSSALNDIERDALGTTIESVLSQEGDFSYLDAYVNSDNGIEITYTPSDDITGAGRRHAMAEIIGTYADLCRTYPTLSDMILNEKHRIVVHLRPNKTIITGDYHTYHHYCLRKWIEGSEPIYGGPITPDELDRIDELNPDDLAGDPLLMQVDGTNYIGGWWPH